MNTIIYVGSFFSFFPFYLITFFIERTCKSRFHFKSQKLWQTRLSLFFCRLVTSSYKRIVKLIWATIEPLERMDLHL